MTMKIPGAKIVTTIPETTLTPDSHQIHSIGYDAERRMCVIRFKSSAETKAYGYPGFSPELWAEFDAAESKGSFFYRRIKDEWATRFVMLPGLNAHSAP